jgi:serine protease
VDVTIIAALPPEGSLGGTTRHFACALVVAALVSVLFALFSPRNAATAQAAIRVPSDVGSIEAALSVAEPRDTILVAAGTYRVNLVWPDTQGITLLSEQGPLTTILDGSDKLQVIGVYSGVDTTTVISGFTITNGHADGM